MVYSFCSIEIGRCYSMKYDVHFPIILSQFREILCGLVFLLLSLLFLHFITIIIATMAFGQTYTAHIHSTHMHISNNQTNKSTE